MIAGVVGFFVVLRGQTFAAHALPLCGFPAVAAAQLFGLSLLASIAGFAVIGAWGVTTLGRRTRRDAATALWLVFILALGDLLLSRLHAYSRAVYGLLFGQILGASQADLVLIAAVGGVRLLAVLLLFRPLLLGTLSPDLLAAAGLSPGRLDFVFLVILALASSAALPVVGALLIFSLMVGPASAARMLTDRPIKAMLISVAFSLVTIWAALLLSALCDWPVGFFVGTIAAAWYPLGRLVGRGGRRQPGTPRVRCKGPLRIRRSSHDQTPARRHLRVRSRIKVADASQPWDAHPFPHVVPVLAGLCRRAFGSGSRLARGPCGRG